MIAFLGLALFHLGGAFIRALAARGGWARALESPSSAWFGIAVAYAVSLGSSGVLVLLMLLAAAFGAGRMETTRPEPARPHGRWWWLVFPVALFVLARPWIPTHWDEFVWLGKARLESLGFGAGARAALDASQHLIPAGYPPLWPAAVGWLSLGQDELSTHVVAASLLVLLCVATALEAPQAGRPNLVGVAALISAPLIWIHLRATYVDLPVGLLGVATLGLLLQSPERPPLLASVLAVVLVSFKDEGLVHVLAATGAALLVHGPKRWRLGLPALVGLMTMATWRWLVHWHQIPLFDHALGSPQWDWMPRLLWLFALHASDIASWGVFWALTTAALALPTKDPLAGASRAMLLMLVLLLGGGLLCGPERVRAFAENGTLLNRLLVQLWPCSALLLMSSLRRNTEPAPARAY